MAFSADSVLKRHLTLRSVFIWAFLISLFALAVRQITNLDPDFWWHLKSGQYILQTRAIPHADPFSFSRAGSAWVAHEWLSEIIMYATFRLAGWAGLLVLFAATITTSLAIVYQRSEGRPFVAAFAVFLAALASAPLFGLRPQMFTFLFASILFALLDRYRQEGRRRLLWAVPPMMLLWVNLHAGFALGPALIVLFVIMAALERNWQRIKPLIATLIICIVVIPINPSGFRMFSYPFETLSSPAMQTLIQEWLSPDFHQFRFLPLAFLMLATFTAVILSPVRIRPGELFGLLVLSLAALRSGRNIPIYALYAAPILAEHSWDWINARDFKLKISSKPVTGVGIALNLLLVLLPTLVSVRRIVDFSRHEKTYEAQSLPAAAVDFVSEQHLPPPIFNDYNWGGYLIWRLYPDHKVFVDGRADLYGDAFIFDYLKTYKGDRDWQARLDNYGISTVLIEPDSALATLLRQQKEWRVAYEDKQAVVFTRK